jgi:hypothetical protein
MNNGQQHCRGMFEAGKNTWCIGVGFTRRQPPDRVGGFEGGFWFLKYTEHNPLFFKGVINLWWVWWVLSIFPTRKKRKLNNILVSRI